PAGIEQLLPGGIVEENGRVVGADNAKQRQYDDRQKGENPAGETPLRGADADFAFDAHAVADDVRRAVEDLRHIASRLLLHQNRGDEELQVSRWDAATH